MAATKSTRGRESADLTQIYADLMEEKIYAAGGNLQDLQ
jgi:hypothetical protein